MTTDIAPAPDADFTSPKGNLYGGLLDVSKLPANVQATMMGYRWVTSPNGSTPASEIKYGFPTDKLDYTRTGYAWPAQRIDDSTPLDANQKAAVVDALALITSYTGLKFSFVAPPSPVTPSAATLRLGNSDGSVAGFPTNDGDYQRSQASIAGDVFLGENGAVPSKYVGLDGFSTIMHEIGHALGLKHGHDTDRGALGAGFNNNQYSVMTYAAFEGADLSGGGATEQRPGSAPQGYMMFDIAALQAYYGVNWDRVGKEAVYRWDDDGQQSINGVRVLDKAIMSSKKIFTTVWTQGANSTFDLGNFNENQVDDMQPGGFLKFSTAQLADLNKNAPAGTANFIAKGNVFNALLPDGDTLSLLRNIKTGAGNDTITGNDADNDIAGGAGDDTILGGAGNDTISGGPGADRIDGGAGVNVLRDTLADMQGDTIVNMGFDMGLHASGSLVGRDHLSVTVTAGGATLDLGGTSLQLTGSFDGGTFMAVPRGGGADAQTTVSFAAFLPALAENASIDRSAINGIVNPAFLTGDGTVKFTVALEQAQSAFHNVLGTYRYGDDNTPGGVHLLFANTLAAARTPVALDTPANGEHIGFFLVQDGARQFGPMADDLSFTMVGDRPVLVSASLGTLANAVVFHTVEALNPGSAIQVLSGASPDGRDLRIAFEDTVNGQGDNDFQDVVIRVHTDRDGLLLI